MDADLGPQDEGLAGEALEGRAAFGGFIGPRRLKSLVRNTAPWLFDGSSPRFRDPPAETGARLHALGHAPRGWWAILRAPLRLEATPEPAPSAWTDYFALCVAAHFGSVATYVPTDVDTKIRDHLWFQKRPDEETRNLREFGLAVLGWDISTVSARIVDAGEGIGGVSGHDGERLSVLAGGLLGLEAGGDAEGAARFEHEIDAELRRESAAFERLARAPGRERDLLVLAAAMAHNAGDVDQGFSARGGRKHGAAAKERFGRLAHERPERYGGAFARAALLYREIMAAEGHRHYPLREIRVLRGDPALLLPVGPFFDDWGRMLALHLAWSAAERAGVLDGIVTGCRKVKGQAGYYRALAGFDRAYPGGIEAADLGRHLGAHARRDLKDAELRRQVAIRRESFESSLFKRARALLALG